MRTLSTVLHSPSHANEVYAVTYTLPSTTSLKINRNIIIIIIIIIIITLIIIILP